LIPFVTAEAAAGSRTQQTTTNNEKLIVAIVTVSISDTSARVQQLQPALPSCVLCRHATKPDTRRRRRGRTATTHTHSVGATGLTTLQKTSVYPHRYFVAFSTF